MNDCTFQPRLSAYYDGELAEAQRTVIENHLSTCPACAAELASYKKLSAVLGRQMPNSLPDETIEHLRTGFRKSAQQHWWRAASAQFERTVRRVTAVAAVILAGASAAWILLPAKPASGAGANEVIVDSLAAGTDSVSSGVTVSSPGSEERQLARWIVADLSQRDRVSGMSERR